MNNRELRKFRHKLQLKAWLRPQAVFYLQWDSQVLEENSKGASLAHLPVEVTAVQMIQIAPDKALQILKRQKIHKIRQGTRLQLKLKAVNKLQVQHPKLRLRPSHRR